MSMLRLRMRGQAVGAASETPILQDITYTIGALTQANQGEVRLSAVDLGLRAIGSPTVASWTIGAATTGTSTHWTRPSADVAEGSSAVTPKPAAAGVSAGLSSGTYVFPVTAKGADGSVSNTANITIVVEPNAASFSNTTNMSVAAIVGSVSAFEAANGGAAKSILISTGSDRSAIRTLADGYAFASDVRVRHADPARPAALATSEWLNSSRLVFEGIVLSGDLTSLPSNGRWYFSASSDITLNGCGVRALNQSHTAGQSTSPYGFKLKGTCTNFVVNDLDLHWVYGGVVFDPSGGSGISSITFNRFRCRYYNDNGFIVPTGVTGLVIDDAIIVAPMRHPDNNGTHPDAFQFSDGSQAEVTMRKILVLDADGDAAAQGKFGDGTSATTPGPLNQKIDGMIVANRSNQGLTEGGSQGTGYIRNVTLIKANGPNVNTAVQTPVDQDDGYQTYGPWFRVAYTTTANKYQGTTLVDSMFVYDQITLTPGPTMPASIVIGSGVVQANIRATNNPASAILDYYTEDPRATLEAITSDQWRDMSLVDMRTLVTTALSKIKPGGPLDRGGGATWGALKPDGTWNDYVVP